MTNTTMPGVSVTVIPDAPGPLRPASSSVLGIIGLVTKASSVPSAGGRAPLKSWTEVKNKLAELVPPSGGLLRPCLYGFFDNGGQAVHILPVLAKPDLQGLQTEFEAAIGKLRTYPDVTIVACPDLAMPDLKTDVQVEIDEGFRSGVYKKLVDECARRQNCFAILDVASDKGSPDKTVAGVVERVRKLKADALKENGSYAAMYYPWVRPAAESEGELVPPSCHVAGVYARVDRELGVHRAPANQRLKAKGMSPVLTPPDIELLNPAGVNCIRTFEGGVDKVWGCRTLDSNSNSPWLYINVRRLFCNAVDTIRLGLEPRVFEPNHPNLWAAIRRDLTVYLTDLWRAGALAGATPEQAFLVRCDESSMTPQDLADGRCVVHVGMAPTRPAEFIEVRISQSTSGTQVTIN